MSPSKRLVFTLGIVPGLAWILGCSGGTEDVIGPDDERPVATGAVISNPLPHAPAARASAPSAGVAFAAEDAAIETDVVYVSLAAGTYPDGATAIITSPRAPGSITASIVNGGLDPVPVPAVAGDTLDLEILSLGGVTLASPRYRVPVARRPRVVRTAPPRGKTDVAVNSSVIIVFSEPVSTASVSPASIGLTRGTVRVAGTVRLLPGSGTVAAFTPNVPLDANTTYRLAVSTAITDVEGDSLESEVSLDFATGTSFTGAPSSIRVSPDTAYVFETSFQLTATVADAAGNELINQTVTWESSDAAGLFVSSTGLLTPRAPGNYFVTARVGDVQGTATVYVRGSPASVSVVPSPSDVPVEEAIVLSAAVRDRGGFALDVPVTWASSAPAVAAVSSTPVGAMVATVRGVALGNATITASSGTVSATTLVTVSPRRAVASVTVTPASETMLIGAAVRLSATLRDANGNAIAGRVITWATQDPRVATVEPNGRVIATGAGTARVTATSDGVSGAATLTVTTLNLASMSATHGHTCGLTAAGAAYCWGRWSNLGAGLFGESSQPMLVPGGLEFTVIAAGMTHTCGLTAPGDAYCWGYGDGGQLGDGTGNHSWTPVRVAGDLTFSSLTAGGPHTCGLTTTGKAYCWGSNSWGQLGDGADNPIPSPARRFVPTEVAGGLTFVALAAGKSDHTCGLTTIGDAYCWGRGDFGKLGNGTPTHSNTPVRVQFAGDFVSITAGWHHSCALAADDTAYCWGGASFGTGFVPRVIASGLAFSALAAGSSHTCGLSTDGRLLCWGVNEEGRLGDGTTTGTGVPTPVAGSLVFSSVTAGGAHTCALTTSGVAYCWGLNAEGQLGNATTTNSTVPLKIAAQP